MSEVIVIIIGALLGVTILHYLRNYEFRNIIVPLENKEYGEIKTVKVTQRQMIHLISARQNFFEKEYTLKILDLQDGYHDLKKEIRLLKENQENRADG